MSLIYVTDPCEGVTGKLITLARPDFHISPSQRYVLVDIGLAAARGAFWWRDYLRLVGKVVRLNSLIHSVEEVAVVVPDVFWNYQKTVESYRKYAPVIKRYGVKLVFVAQELKAPELDKLDPEPVIIALPARKHGNVICARQPSLCAKRLADAATHMRDLGFKVHLLGPPRRVLLQLTDMLGRQIRSFDTMSYRRAPSRRVRVGGYMATRQTACLYLKEWLRGIA